MELCRMSDNQKDEKLTQVWKSQTTEGFRMSPADLERRIADGKRRSRRERRVGLAAAVTVVLAWIGVILLGDHPARVWLYAVGFASYLVWLIQLPGMSASNLHAPSLVALSLIRPAEPCLEFYKEDLESHRYVLRYGRTPWAIAGVIGLLLFVFGLGSPRTDAAAFLGLALFVAAIVTLIRSWREGPRIQKAIDDLNNFVRSAG